MWRGVLAGLVGLMLLGAAPARAEKPPKRLLGDAVYSLAWSIEGSTDVVGYWPCKQKGTAQFCRVRVKTMGYDEAEWRPTCVVRVRIDDDSWRYPHDLWGCPPEIYPDSWLYASSGPNHN